MHYVRAIQPCGVNRLLDVKGSDSESSRTRSFALADVSDTWNEKIFLAGSRQKLSDGPGPSKD